MSTLQDPQVTVLLRVYNGEAHIRETMHSLLAQTMEPVEFLVIDDGSSDRTQAILAEFDDPRIRIVTQTNQGRGAAAQRGITEARAELIAILDADDRSHPDRLRLQAEYLQAHPDVVIVGGAMKIVNAGGKALGVRRYPADDEALRKALLLYNPFAHPTIMFRRDPALACGGYTRRFTIVEDYDFILRLLRHGRGANLREVVTEYRMDERSAGKTKLRETIAARRIASREYGYPRSAGSLAVDAAQRALVLLPVNVVSWLFARVFFRRK